MRSLAAPPEIVGSIMTRTLVSSGSRFEAEIGYSRAVVDGEWIFVSGTAGYNFADHSISEDVAEQIFTQGIPTLAGIGPIGHLPDAGATSFQMTLAARD